MANVVFVALLAWGIYKCVDIAQRPTSNAKCAYSLGIVLAAISLVLTAGSIFMSTDCGGQIAMLASHRMFLALSLVAYSIIAAVGVVLAILGLWEIQQSRTADDFAPTPGRGLGIFALVLSTVLIGAPMVAGMVSGLRG